MSRARKNQIPAAGLPPREPAGQRPRSTLGGGKRHSQPALIGAQSQSRAPVTKSSQQSVVKGPRMMLGNTGGDAQERENLRRLVAGGSRQRRSAWRWESQIGLLRSKCKHLKAASGLSADHT